MKFADQGIFKCSLPLELVRPKTLAEEIRSLTDLFKERPVLFSEVVAAVHGRGYDLMLILISLPFLTPIPLPLLSTAFGTVVLIAGTRLAFGQRPWWPQWLLAKQLPPKFFTRFLTATSKIVAVVEFFVKPRLQFFHHWLLFQRVAGILIAISGALLLLPLPVPFSNFFPALTVMLLASGALERDGLFFLAGCIAFAVSLAYFTLLFLGGWEAVSRLIPFLDGR